MIIRRITAVGLLQRYLERLRGNACCSPGQPRPLRRFRALFDPFLWSAATAVEDDNTLGGRGRVPK